MPQVPLGVVEKIACEAHVFQVIVLRCAGRGPVETVNRGAGVCASPRDQAERSLSSSSISAMRSRVTGDVNSMVRAIE